MNKQSSGCRYALAVLLALELSPNVYSLAPIGEQQGWSGYLMAGVGHSNVESNTVAGNDVIDGGQETIGSIYDDPRSSSVNHGIAGFEINYTLENRNQVFFGSALEDQLTLDFGSQVGWRKQTDKTGIFQLGYLFSGVPAEVWEDPYLAGTKRKETERNTSGARFVWDKIMGSAFEFTAQVRELDLDKERSGTDPALGCDLDCQRLLERDGDQTQLWLSYTFIHERSHIFRPQIRYRQEDRDGKSQSRDAYALQFSYSYLTPKWIVVTNAVYSQSSFDRANPLYGKKQDADTLALDASVLYRLPIEGGRWQVLGSVFWAESDSDINFHDSKLNQILFGVIYNFGIQPGLQ